MGIENFEDNKQFEREETPEIEQPEQLNNLKNEFENFSIKSIEEKNAEEILKKVEVHGSEFNGQFLTPEILKKEGLLPKHKIHIGEKEDLIVSSAYQLSEGRMGVVAFVQKNGKIVTRSYYLSNSQATWRYLPSYIMNEGKIIWYDKGYREESINLPMIIQKGLSEITQEDQSILKVKNPDLILAGATHQIWEKSSYYEEVMPKPKKIEGNIHSEDKSKIPPKQIKLESKQSPDFSKLLTSWEQKSNLYGKVTAEVFPSKDGELKFMFFRDTKGRAWIGGIEDNSEIGPTGLKKSWVFGGDLVTPAYEYDDITEGYGNEKMRKGHYVDMYENYLSKIPNIKRYQRNKSVSHKKINKPTD